MDVQALSSNAANKIHEQKAVHDGMKPQTVDALKSLAVHYEAIDIEVSLDLMRIAHQLRISDPFIKHKLHRYNAICKSNETHMLYNLHRNGRVAIIPVGFRCFTKRDLSVRFGISQPTLPFCVGFFPPSSVVSILNTPRVCFDFNDLTADAVCIKQENHHDPVLGKGISFTKSSYQEINSSVVSRDMKNINRYLDTTFGYYTLNSHHNFILAHYNWHEFADPKYSGGIVDPQQNLRKINDILNRRIERMFELCKSAELVIFVYHNDQSYDYMRINEDVFDLSNFAIIQECVEDTFQAESCVVTLDHLGSSHDLAKCLNRFAS